MNAEYVNPFIQGSQRVLEMLCGERPEIGKVSLKKPPYPPQQVAIAVSITGEVQGTVVYTMELATGLFIVSKMMGGMEVAALDELSQSALSEMANMTSGNVATAFSEKGILTDITPPTFMGDSYPNLQGNVVCIPLTLSGGHTIGIDVCVQ